jgi:hypothetical protein
MTELSAEQKRILEKMKMSDNYGNLEPNSADVSQDFVRPKNSVAFPGKTKRV